jgi:hypothetical protein
VVLGVQQWWKNVHRLAVSTCRLSRGGPDIVCSLAMAEMTALVGAVYRRYETSIAPGFENKSPAITSRFETFYDVTLPEIEVSLGIYSAWRYLG